MQRKSRALLFFAAKVDESIFRALVWKIIGVRVFNLSDKTEK